MEKKMENEMEGQGRRVQVYYPEWRKMTTPWKPLFWVTAALPARTLHACCNWS